MFPASLRGTSITGPDGFRVRCPNAIAALVGRVTPLGVPDVGSIDRHLPSLPSCTWHLHTGWADAPATGIDLSHVGVDLLDLLAEQCQHLARNHRLRSGYHEATVTTVRPPGLPAPAGTVDSVRKAANASSSLATYHLTQKTTGKFGQGSAIHNATISVAVWIGLC